MANTPFYRIEIENLNLKTRLKMETQVKNPKKQCKSIGPAMAPRYPF